MSALRNRVLRSGPWSGNRAIPIAGAAVQGVVVQCERLGQRRAQLDGDIDGFVAAGIGQQHRELVATQARPLVASPQPLIQAGADLDQQQVPGVVAQTVIDLALLERVRRSTHDYAAVLCHCPPSRNRNADRW
jgi:hypothetical protein